MTESLSPELNGAHCTIADCFDVADVMGRATIQVNRLVGLTPGQDALTLGLPLCAEHAHLLRMGGQLVAFNSGM